MARFLRVAERLLDAFETQFLRRLHRSLHRDGYDVDDQTGQVAAIGPQLSIESLAKLSDPSAIREGFDRIRRAISDDPALAVGSAKELVESTAKVVLTERGQVVDDKADLPKLARAAQLALGLDPSTGSEPAGLAQRQSGIASVEPQARESTHLVLPEQGTRSAPLLGRPR